METLEDKLKDKFFKECTNQRERLKFENPNNGPDFHINKDPEFVFNWFVDNLNKKSIHYVHCVNVNLGL